MIYEDNTLKRILVDGDYIEDGKYHFYVQDHLGNNRMVVDQEGAVAQITHYYPFGMSFAESTEVSKQPYKYNGKELDMENNMNTYDYEARLLSVAVPRFTSMDPLAEKYYSISPYAYVMNNPLKYIDPDGRFLIFLVPIIKGAVGAITDAAAQVTISMANGQNLSQAMSSVDYTSVGASFAISAIADPGMSTAAKVATVGVITVDAAVDINIEGEVQSIGGLVGENKPIINAMIDAVTSTVPGKAVDNLSSSFNKAINSDLSSNAAATLTKETKSSMKQVQSIVNSTGFQTGANAVADYTGGLIGGQANKAITTKSNSNFSIPNPIRTPIVQPNDATRVQKNIIYPKYQR